MTTGAGGRRPIAVLKLGGSVLTGVPAFAAAAGFVARRLQQRGTPLVVVVSAERGQTDALHELARTFGREPDRPTLDLLWSTGELRSVALLTLALQAQGIRAVGANVHQTGISRPSALDDAAGCTELRPLRLFSLLAGHDVVVVPGFLARTAGDGVTSLGRGGSDLTAVLVAAALGAVECELVKDVDGYYTANPHLEAGARHLPSLAFADAIEMAESGCGLVQREALVAAARHDLPLSIHAIDSPRRTLVSASESAR